MLFRGRESISFKNMYLLAMPQKHAGGNRRMVTPQVFSDRLLSET